MEEDWGAEAAARPEPTFSLKNLTPSQNRPKQAYLKYLKTVHGREKAAKAMTEFHCLKVTDANFTQWKEESLHKAIHKMENPPKNLSSIMSASSLTRTLTSRSTSLLQWRHARDRSTWTPWPPPLLLLNPLPVPVRNGYQRVSAYDTTRTPPRMRTEPIMLHMLQQETA